MVNYIGNLAGTDSLEDLIALDKCIFYTLNGTEPNARSQLDSLRRDNLNKIIFAYLNINSIRNKFDHLADLIKGKIDVLMISESKIDDSFRDSQFFLDGYSTPHRLDRKRNGGGKMLFVRNDIPSKKISIEKLPTESFLIELYLRKKRWLISYSYNPNNGNIESHLDTVSKSLDMHLKRYKNVILLGGFNANIKDSFMKNFCENFDLRSLVKEPACFKNPENSSCIDLILTKKPRSFIKAGVIETGLSDYHKLVTTVMKMHFPKSKPSIITYKSYKKFDNKKFMENLNAEIITQVLILKTVA